MKDHLLLCGPTEVPPRILQAMNRPIIGHRTQAMSDLSKQVHEGLQAMFGAELPPVIFPGSGTGAMESAVVNLFSPGERVLVSQMGVFGKRFAEIARAFGLEVEILETEWGEAVTFEQLHQKLTQNRQQPQDQHYRGLLLTQNETSAGVKLDLAALSAVFAEYEDLLVAVDAVSAFGGIAMRQQAWGIDVVATSTQKALMCPPGLGIASLSPRALDRSQNSSSPKFYWDYGSYRDRYQRSQQTPTTPALPQWFALKEALAMIDEEGLDNVYQRHQRMGAMIRAGAAALGLDVLAQAGCASDTVTAVILPEEIPAAEIRQALESQFGIEVAGGKGPLAPRIFRIGHMGYAQPEDMLMLLSALEVVLPELGFEPAPGSGVAAAEDVWRKGEQV